MMAGSPLPALFLNRPVHRQVFTHFEKTGPKPRFALTVGLDQEAGPDDGWKSTRKAIVFQPYTTRMP
jgi:hypothetical protein